MNPFEQITHTPGVMGGRACIRGSRLTVGMIVGRIGAGATPEQLLSDFPTLEREDVYQAIQYAAWAADEREVLLTA